MIKPKKNRKTLKKANKKNIKKNNKKNTKNQRKLASGFINDANIGLASLDSSKKEYTDRLIIDSNGNTKYFKKDPIKKPESSVIVYQALYMSPNLAERYKKLKTKKCKINKKCKNTVNEFRYF